MKVRDVMTTEPVTVGPDSLLKEAARTMVTAGISGLPVVDGSGDLVGVVTEGDFLRREAARDKPYRMSLVDALFGDGPASPPEAERVEEVMTEAVITITADASLSEAARIMTARSVKRLPVVDPDGAMVGIVSRADIVGAFTKPDEVIQDEIREDIIRRLMLLDPGEYGVDVADGVVTLRGEMENRTEARMLEELVRRIDGVVRVDSELTFIVDDRKLGTSYPIS